MQTNAIESLSTYSHEQVLTIVDGDGFTTLNNITGKRTEFRLLGIDAPELKTCSKICQDEKETHMAAGLLMKLGQESKKFLSSLLPIGEKVIIVQEANNMEDIYGRQLAYAYLPNSNSKNDQSSNQPKQVKVKPISKNNSTTPTNKQVDSIYTPLSINELLVLNGYAKPYNKVNCRLLPNIQLLYNEAKQQKKGLFKLVSNF